MCEELSYQIINTSAVNQSVFCYYQTFAKIIIEKKHQCWRQQARQRYFFEFIYLRETWLNVFILVQVSMSFSTFIFSTSMKLFIRHPVVLFCILILSEQFDGFVQLTPWCSLKDRQLCLHKYVQYLVLYPIIVQAKQTKIQDMTLTIIRLLL